MQHVIHLSQNIEWNKTLGQPWHSVILAVVGVVFALLAMQDWSSTSERMAVSTEVEGIVVDYVEGAGRIYPMVQYHDHQGRLYTVQAATAVGEADKRPFATMSVLYPSDAPADGKVASLWDVWTPTLRGAILAITFLAGALFLWSRRADIYTLDGKKH